MKKFFAQFIIVLLTATTTFSQTGSVALNTDGSSAHASVLLDIKSNNQGILIPRMTATQRTIIASPAAGLMVYQTDLPTGFYLHSGSDWVSLNSNLPSQSGNAGKVLTTDAPIYVGLKSSILKFGDTDLNTNGSNYIKMPKIKRIC